MWRVKNYKTETLVIKRQVCKVHFDIRFYL